MTPTRASTQLEVPVDSVVLEDLRRTNNIKVRQEKAVRVPVLDGDMKVGEMCASYHMTQVKNQQFLPNPEAIPAIV